MTKSMESKHIEQKTVQTDAVGQSGMQPAAIGSNSLDTAPVQHRVSIQPAGKQELRRQMRAIRKAVADRTEKSRQILDNLRRVPVFQKAGCLFLYVSCQTEVETREWIPALLAEGRSVAVPKVTGSEMAFYAISSMEDLAPGAYGILEPKADGRLVMPDAGSCMLLPGLAFDEAGHRMGYGGGYYDRYLEHHPHCSTIAVAYEAQVIREVPVEPHDRILQWIVTEEKVREIRTADDLAVRRQQKKETIQEQ